jgi:hypothetical protein
VASAIFGNDSDDKVEYITLDGFSRFHSLEEGRIDVLARSTTHTMERALYEVRSVGRFCLSLSILRLLYTGSIDIDFVDNFCSLFYFGLPRLYLYGFMTRVMMMMMMVFLLLGILIDSIGNHRSWFRL